MGGSVCVPLSFPPLEPQPPVPPPNSARPQALFGTIPKFTALKVCGHALIGHLTACEALYLTAIDGPCIWVLALSWLAAFVNEFAIFAILAVNSRWTGCKQS